MTDRANPDPVGRTSGGVGTSRSAAPDDRGDAEAERACAAAMTQAGLVVPTDLWAGTVAGYVELRALARLLRGRRPAHAEPAAVFRVQPPGP